MTKCTWNNYSIVVKLQNRKRHALYTIYCFGISLLLPPTLCIDISDRFLYTWCTKRTVKLSPHGKCDQILRPGKTETHFLKICLIDGHFIKPGHFFSGRWGHHRITRTSGHRTHWSHRTMLLNYIPSGGKKCYPLSLTTTGIEPTH